MNIRLFLVFLVLPTPVLSLQSTPHRLVDAAAVRPRNGLLMEVSVAEETSSMDMDMDMDMDTSSQAGGKPVSSSGSRTFLVKTALASVATVSVAAKSGLFPGSSTDHYTWPLIAHDVGASTICIILGYTFVKIITWMASKEILQTRDSRKVIHTCSAPLFMLLWPLFTPAGKWFAACTPFTNAIRLYLAGKGSGEADLANAVSRSGDVSEAGAGPFIYCIIMLASIGFFWTKSLVGVVALCTMAVGDGLADLVGRRFGKGNRWFFSKSKSVAGTMAFWVGAMASSVVLSMWLSAMGTIVLPFPLAKFSLRLAAITGLCALIELIPIGDDNWNVPVAAAVLGQLLLTT